MRPLFLAAAVSLVAMGCGSSESNTTPLADAGANTGNNTGNNNQGSGPLPDFALMDTNSTSPFSGQSVSPRQFLEKVSGWYFTHAS